MLGVIVPKLKFKLPKLLTYSVPVDVVIKVKPVLVDGLAPNAG